VDRTGGPSGRPLDVRVLGPVEVVGPDGPIELRPGLSRVLLLALVVRAGRAVPADVLVEQLWGDHPPENPANSLQVNVSYLRRQLRPVTDRIAIERQGNGYRVAVDLDAIDAHRFERAIEGAAAAAGEVRSAAGVERLLAAVDEALAAWRDTPFADAAGLPFTEADAARLEELRLVALEQRAELLGLLGRHAEAVAWLQPLVAEHPLRERLWALLVTALYRDGRQADALRAYGAARRHLVDELGIEPGPALRDVERAVLAQDPALAWSPLPDGDDHTAPVVDRVPPEAAERDAAEREQERAGGDGSAGTPRRRAAIPASISPLIGRLWEVGAVGELIDQHRLVTLVGPGGVGKTRLAYEAARTRTAATAAIELGAVDDPARLPSVVAAAVPVPTTPGRDPLEVVADRIGDDDWLLVLDTCEHLLDAVAAAAAGLLHACPNLRILATSRQALGVAGELAWPVPVLDLPEEGGARATDVAAAASVRLFVERARAANPRFELTDDNAAAVAAICRALDGLPLALELAAGRAGVLSPAAIRDRLDDRFALLSRGSRDAARRQRSLRATVEWSHELLSDEERRCFAALGVFSGGFDLPAAEAVTDFGGDVLDVVAGLVDRSLVVAGGHDRYHLLDTLQAFADERLRAETDPRWSAGAVRRRHAEWFAALAIECDPHAHGPLPKGWPRLRADAANLRAALRWAFGPDGDPALGARMVGALAGSMCLDGAFAEADEWLERARPAAADDVTAAALDRGTAVVALYQGRYDECVAASRRSVTHAEATGDPVLIASCALPLGSALWGAGALDESIAVLRAAAERFDAAGDVRGRGFALARLARSLADAGDPTAVETAIAAVDDLESSSDDWMTVGALDHLAYALLLAGDVDAARDRAEAAGELAERIGSYSGHLSALTLIGRAHLASGDTTGATAAHVQAVERAGRVGNAGMVIENLDALADVAAASDEPALAASLAAAAQAGRDRSGTPGRAAGVAARTRRLEVLGAALGDDALAAASAAGAGWEPAEALDRVRAAIG
jgi:predicted ATPase/DNA-binding SARP family transcriptional activator